MFVAVIRTFTERGTYERTKGPFEGQYEAMMTAELAVGEGNGPGGCGDILIVPVALYNSDVHEIGCRCIRDEGRGK